MDKRFGTALKTWRQKKRWTQMDLAARTGVSTRHLSFLETSRSSASREMVLALAQSLELSLKASNDLLQTAGFAANYRDSRHGPAKAEVEALIGRYLQAQDRLPCTAVDRRYNVLGSNVAAQALVQASCMGHTMDPALADNLLKLILSPMGLRPVIQNWEELAPAFVSRVRRELQEDEADLAWLEDLLKFESIPSQRSPAVPVAGPSLPLRLLVQGKTLSFLTVIASFGTPLDAALQNLRLETLLPADAATESALAQLLAAKR